MKKVNLLSRAEMRKVLGGVADEEGDLKCNLSPCEFYGPGHYLLKGWCGLSSNNKQCRCISYDKETNLPYQSIESDSCYLPNNV